MNKLRKLRSFIKNLKLAYQYLKDPEVSLINKIIAILPVIYIVMPFDGDFFPVIGWLDDTLVTIVIWSYILKKLRAYQANETQKQQNDERQNNGADYEFKDDEYDIE